MDPLEISCPNCFKTGNVPLAYAGRRVRCANCNEAFLVEGLATLSLSQFCVQATDPACTGRNAFRSGSN